MKRHLSQGLLALNQQFDCVIRGLERMERELFEEFDAIPFAAPSDSIAKRT
jgi:hypothetical protein